MREELLLRQKEPPPSGSSARLRFRVAILPRRSRYALFLVTFYGRPYEPCSFGTWRSSGTFYRRDLALVLLQFNLPRPAHEYGRTFNHILCRTMSSDSDVGMLCGKPAVAKCADCG